MSAKSGGPCSSLGMSALATASFRRANIRPPIWRAVATSNALSPTGSTAFGLPVALDRGASRRTIQPCLRAYSRQSQRPGCTARSTMTEPHNGDGQVARAARSVGATSGQGMAASSRARSLP
eukprot:scaffold48005_cov31-Tisochrysis_lutea.AAC.8